jgi:hypothetical protein
MIEIRGGAATFTRKNLSDYLGLHVTYVVLRVWHLRQPPLKWFPKQNCLLDSR